MEQCRRPLCSNEVGEGGEGEAGGVGARNRRVARNRGETDGAQQMALLEASLTQVSLEAEDILQPDPEQWCVGQGEDTGEEDIHWSDLQVALTVVGPSQNKGPDVHWDKVRNLKTGTRYKYINYTDVIEMERLPAISPFTDVYAGALYAKLPEDGFRCVYFEPQPDPARPVMRVARNVEGNDTVKTSYPWERVNFVYKVVEGTYKCCIYTPANLDSYGLVVEGENVHFEPTPRQGPKPNFTRFDIELTPKQITVIKVDNGLGLGLYVDENDGWRVKATPDQTKWNAFRIVDFQPQHPPTPPPSERCTSRRRIFRAYIRSFVLNLLMYCM